MVKRKQVTLEVTFEEYPFAEGENPFGWAARVAEDNGGTLYDVDFVLQMADVTSVGDPFERRVPGVAYAVLVLDVPAGHR